MPPVSIKRFEKLFFASLALTLLATLIDYETISNWAATQNPVLDGPIADIVVELLISLPLWYFIVRKASNTAKWGLVGLTALGAISILWLYREFVGVSTTYAVLNGVSFVLLLGSVAMLFKHDALVWLGASVDPEVFS